MQIVEIRGAGVALTCKNCGGNISLDVNSNLIICDSCGAQQTLTNALADESENFIYDEDDIPDDYECPLCEVGPDLFEEVQE